MTSLDRQKQNCRLRLGMLRMDMANGKIRPSKQAQIMRDYNVLKAELAQLETATTPEETRQ